MVARGRVRAPRKWNTRSSVKSLARVSWSWAKIADVMRLTVSTLAWSLLMAGLRSVWVCSSGPYEARDPPGRIG